ncbi:HSP20 family protein [Marchantia polymorpha subsp. ruderalis]
MALIPRAFGNSVFDPFFGSSIFDSFENLSASLFDRAFPSFDKDVSAVANTRVDWVETPEAHVFKADLPGMKKEEIKIQVADDGVLSISGERSKEKVDEKDNYRRSERSFGKFFRQFKLPANAKAQEISAKVDNGVLTVTVPKTEESKKKSEIRTVEITG